MLPPLLEPRPADIGSPRGVRGSERKASFGRRRGIVMTSMIVTVVLGLLFLAVRRPLLRILAFLLVRKAVRGALTEVGKAALDKVDDVVSLVPEKRYCWKDEGIEARYVEPLRRLGFADAGGFAVDRMPGVHVQLLVHVRD